MLLLHNSLRLFGVVGRYAIDMTRKLITALSAEEVGTEEEKAKKKDFIVSLKAMFAFTKSSSSYSHHLLKRLAGLSKYLDFFSAVN